MASRWISATKPHASLQLSIPSKGPLWLFSLIHFSGVFMVWLKVHHPAEFYTGIINNRPMGFYSVHSLIHDAKRRGVKIRPVSCVHSGELTEVTGDREIRLGLQRIKGLRRETAASSPASAPAAAPATHRPRTSGGWLAVSIASGP